MYEHDVYISYDRESETVSPWVRHHFHPRLRELLDDNLVDKVRVFFDQDVGGGTKFPEALHHALQRTKVLVAVCSPKYFYNEWCLAEWHSMAGREEHMGLHGTGLIFPVIYSDSYSFPDSVLRRNPVDLRDWNEPRAHYQDSPAYFDFRKQVGRLAEDMVHGLLEPPPWQPDWPLLRPVPGVLPTMRLPGRGAWPVR
ncbi:toll/interleukin-1 receptor domain-containing protein [Actinokineospora cianjurensis]|uniref:TIR domain-containing protein n=1 Tax=Actinokineospora cianjurensis TaxID=585224 RepID=A0A421AYS7_9PSEU|nr:toll/interleukin-1 receptor domain-containing protein [Actinokineospora cianjurensis]RLK54955.1 TIR domain-containing protein [Actinokineospora cianjurensis]